MSPSPVLLLVLSYVHLHAVLILRFHKLAASNTRPTLCQVQVQKKKEYISLAMIGPVDYSLVNHNAQGNVILSWLGMLTTLGT